MANKEHIDNFNLSIKKRIIEFVKSNECVTDAEFITGIFDEDLVSKIMEIIINREIKNNGL